MIMDSLQTTNASRKCQPKRTRKRTRQEALSSTLGVIGATIWVIANVRATIASRPFMDGTGSSSAHRGSKDLNILAKSSSSSSFAKSSALQHILALHRGGESASGDNNNSNNNNNAEMSDEDIDEYIDFLLAYAEDRAVETDNPLFKSVASAQAEETEEAVQPTAEMTVEDLSSSESDINVEEEEEEVTTPEDEEADDVEEKSVTIDTASLSATEEVQVETVEQTAKVDVVDLSDTETEPLQETGDDIEPIVSEIELESAHDGVIEEAVSVPLDDLPDTDTVEEVEAVTIPPEVDDEEEREAESQDEGNEGILSADQAIPNVEDDSEALDVQNEELDDTPLLQEISEELTEEVIAGPVMKQVEEDVVEFALEEVEEATVEEPEAVEPVGIAEKDDSVLSDTDTGVAIEQDLTPSVDITDSVQVDTSGMVDDPKATDEDVAPEFILGEAGSTTIGEQVAVDEVITIGDEVHADGEQSEVESDNIDELTNAATNTTRSSFFKSFWQKPSWGKKAGVEDATTVSEATDVPETSLSVDKAASSVSMAAIQQTVKQNYDSSLRYMQTFWNKPRGSPDEQIETSVPDSTSARKDYNKIYEKYLMPTQSSQSEMPVENEPVAEKRNRSGYLIQKPWGTMLKLIKKRRSDTDAKPATRRQVPDSVQEDSSCLTALNSKRIVDEIVDEVVEQSDAIAAPREGEASDEQMNSSDTTGESSFLDSLNSQQIVDEATDGVVSEKSAGVEPSHIIDDAPVERSSETEVHALSDLRKEEPDVPTIHVEATDDVATKEDTGMNVEETPQAIAVDDDVTLEEEADETDTDVTAPIPSEEEESEGSVDEPDSRIDEAILVAAVEEEVDSSDLEIVEDDEEELRDTFDDVDFNVDDDESEVEDIVEKDLASDLTMPSEDQGTNVVWKFLLARGLEAWVMTLILIFEWFQFYVFAPIQESAKWLVTKAQSEQLLNGDGRLPKWLNARGGAVSDMSEDEEIDLDEARSAGEDELSEESPEPDADANEESNADEAAVDSDDQSEKAQNDQSDDIHSTPQNGMAERDADPSTPRIRPNRLYRFLLGYGYVGHVVIMECILLVEWLKVYVPYLPDAAAFVMFEILRFEKPSQRGSGESAVLRTSGFLGADGTSVRAGKKKKAQTKKEDQRALDQLKRLGDVNQARYHFLTKSFMKRHALGEYGSDKKDSISFQIEKETVFEDVPDMLDGEAAESDAEWIVEALAQEEDEEEEVFGSTLEPDVGLSFGSEGPKVSVGVGFSIGKDPAKRSKSRSSSLSSIARQSSSPVKKKKAAGPRISDSQSGVMGRIRAAGASSIMGRNLLGAYPGDLPPPQEAADPRGMYELAERYGWGDWSSDEDEDDDSPEFMQDDDSNNNDDDENDEDDFMAPPKARKRSSGAPKKKKRRRKRSSSSSSSANIGFGVSFGGGLDTPPSSTRKSSTASTIRKTSRISTSSRSVDLLGGRDVPKSSSSRTPPGSQKRSRSADAFKKSQPVRPAMSLLDEIKAKKGSKDADLL